MEETYTGSLEQLRQSSQTLPNNFRVTLTGLKGSVQGKHYRLTQSLAAIGRKSGEVVINDPTLSGRHAEFEVIEKKVFVTDLESTNGTYVNGTAVRRAELKNFDTLRLGDLEFQVHIYEDRYLTVPDEEAEEAIGQMVKEEEIAGTRRLGTAPPQTPAALKGRSLYLGIVIKDQKRVFKVEHQSTVIGSQEGDVILEDDSVSARHCQIEILDNGVIRAKDLASTNGTLKNGKTLSVEEVTHGDWLKLGETFIKILIRPPSASTPAA